MPDLSVEIPLDHQDPQDTSMTRIRAGYSACFIRLKGQAKVFHSSYPIPGLIGCSRSWRQCIFDGGNWWLAKSWLKRYPDAIDGSKAPDWSKTAHNNNLQRIGQEMYGYSRIAFTKSLSIAAIDVIKKLLPVMRAK